MSGRLTVLAVVASLATVAIGAVLAHGTIVAVGMVASMLSGLVVVIKTEDTTQPMLEILLAESNA